MSAGTAARLAFAARGVGGALGAAAMALPLWPGPTPWPGRAVVVAGGLAYLLVLARAATGLAADGAPRASRRWQVALLALAGAAVVAAVLPLDRPSAVLAAAFAAGAAGVAYASGGGEGAAAVPRRLAASGALLLLGLAGLAWAAPSAARVGVAALLAFVAPGLAWAPVLRPGARPFERLLWAPVYSMGVLVPALAWASALRLRIGPGTLLALCLTFTAAGLVAGRWTRETRE